MFVSVEFISDKSGEYEGVEYPPSPSRFVQAIIAGTHGDSKYMPVLHHLETIAPRIYATPEFSSYDYETYVPKNSWDSGRGQNFEQRNASRRKQVKTRLFHSSGAHVVYEYDVPQELRDLFTEAVKSVTVLGRAMDIVLVNVHDTRPAGDFDAFVPDAVNARGTQVYLHTPVIGFVDSVFKKYVNKVKTLTVEDRGYTKNPQRVLSRALFELTHPVRIEQTSYVAAWVRHAAMLEARKDVAEAISGHRDESVRLMIVPVPTLYYGDRMIRNVIVTGENQALVRAAEAGLAGLHLTDNDGHDMGYLIPTEHDAVFSQFLHPSRRWVSVTPILMSGHDDRNERKRRKLLSKMFRHAGLPVPMAVSRMPTGANGVTDFKVPSQHGHDKLHRMMCAVEFDTEVAGVVAIGTGRFTGLGVFANLAASATA